jgi:transcriptional regulator with XRE-family HTH domain
VSIGARIRKAREEKRLSQRALGTAVGVSNEAVRQWEGGWSRPSAENLPALASALGVTVDELLRDDAEQAPLAPEQVVNEPAAWSESLPAPELSS